MGKYVSHSLITVPARYQETQDLEKQADIVEN